MSVSDRTLAVYITTKDREIRHEMLGDENTRHLADGITIKSGGMTIHETLNFPETYTFLVTVAQHVIVPVAVGLLTNYIYEKLKSKLDIELKIGKVEVRLDKGEIERVILEDLEIREKK